MLFRSVRDIGTVLVGPDAVSCGLIDEVGGLSQAVHKLESLIAEQPSRPPGQGRQPQ